MNCDCFCDCINWQTFWTAVGAIAATVGLYGLWYGQRLKTWNECQNIFTDPVFLVARTILLKLIPENDNMEIELPVLNRRNLKSLRDGFGITDYKTNYSNEERKEILQTIAYYLCGQMDKFCHLAPSVGVLPFTGEDKMIAVWWNPIGKLWWLLEDVVQHERDRLHSTKKWDEFENIGKKCAKRIVEIEHAKIEEVRKFINESLGINEKETD
ncbi:MAG: hypothetical protein HY841_09690 [Bacteroidetes bacterium]|nr:hypothetical protein [Bacteroidota bacterium]